MLRKISLLILILTATPHFASAMSSDKSVSQRTIQSEESEEDIIEYEGEADEDLVPAGYSETVVNGGSEAGEEEDDDLAAKAGSKKKKSCKCSSGCGMNQSGLKPIIKKYVKAAAKSGIHPVSCIRTQACQDRLRACYTRCGQPGRAAKKSKHADGRACDFSKKHASGLSRVKRQTGLPIKRLTHGKEGGGLHEYQ